MSTSIADDRFADLNIPGLASKSYAGKVRNVYETKDGYLIMVTSDRISAFDHILPKAIPNKGIVLNMLTQHALKAVHSAVPHWLLCSPHPRVLFGYKCTPLKVEVIVRGYLGGSLWRAYQKENDGAGYTTPWGHEIPPGMREGEKFPSPLITPTTKADTGHDENISVEEIIAQGLCSKEQWDHVEQYALTLFAIGTKDAAEHELILADTKYEFGIDKDGNIRLIDEIHTADSSRFFYADMYEANLETGMPQKQLSKEFVREWLMERNFMGEEGQTMPEISDHDIRVFEGRYYELLKAMTGTTINPKSLNEQFSNSPEIIEREIMRTLRKYRAPKAAVVMGSKSDFAVMKAAADVLDTFCVGYHLSTVSAHRTPDLMVRFAEKAKGKGIKVIIAGAGGAAHLPGMVAANTSLPVIGVPVKSSNSLNGIDSIYSILQMPSGVPVATVALDCAANAALLALQIMALFDPFVEKQMDVFKESLKGKVYEMQEGMVKDGYMWSFD